MGSTDGLYGFGAAGRRAFDGHEVTALAREAARAWALVDGRAVWRSRPDGAWEEVARLEAGPATCLAATAPGLLVGTAGAHLFRLDDGRLRRVEAFERVEGRRAWHTPWGDPPDTRSISADAGSAVYVNVHVGGVARSTDGGRSWHPTLDIEADVHQVLCHPRREGFVLAAAAVGLGISDDGGRSWRFETAGLHARYLRAVAVAGEYLLVSASTGPGGKRAAIYRKRFGSDGPFERCRQGLPEWFPSNVDTGCLAASGMTVAVGTDEGLVFLSADAGASWELLAKDLPPVQGLVLA
ncbi:MAG: hypothetical protein HYV61_09010 [Candidatus Rokubacteria bacterium]|nr:hypothetical protein [Candidatus Rokubacteria bacterium]